MKYKLTSPPERSLDYIIRQGILETLEAVRWIYVDAAAILLINPTTLRRNVLKYGIQEPANQPEVRRLLGRAGGRPRKIA